MSGLTNTGNGGVVVGTGPSCVPVGTPMLNGALLYIVGDTVGHTGNVLV